MEVVEVALTPKEIMGDGLKMLNFQESKGLYVLFFLMYIIFPVLIIITEMIVQMKFQFWTWICSDGKAESWLFQIKTLRESRPMVSFSPLRSWSLNNHNRQAEAFPFLWDPGLTGNYSSACLLTMEIDFIQTAKSTQTHACMPSVSVLGAVLLPHYWGLLGIRNSRLSHPLARDLPCCTLVSWKAALSFRSGSPDPVSSERSHT